MVGDRARIRREGGLMFGLRRVCVSAWVLTVVCRYSRIHVMSTMIAEVYDALKEAGASEEKAKAAAMALADYGSRFDRIDRDLADVKADISGLKTDVAVLKADVTLLKTDFAVQKAELGMVKWIVSGVGFGVVLLVLRSFWSG